MLLINFIRKASGVKTGYKSSPSSMLFFIVFTLSFSLGFAQNNKKALDSILNVASQKKTDSLQVDYLNAVFFNYSYSNPELSKLVILEAIKKSKAINNPYLLTRAYLRKGIYHDVVNQKDSALYMYDESLKLASINKDDNAIAAAFNNIGLIHWNNENYNEALDYYVKGLKIFETLNDARGQSSCLNNMALILAKLQRYKEAIYYNRQAIVLREKINDTYGLGASYTNISKDYSCIKQNDSAKYYLRKAIAIKKDIKDKRGLAIAYNNMGLILESEKKSDSAIYYLDEANTIYKTINAQKLRGENIIALGKLYLNAKNFTKAISCYLEGYELISEDDLDTKLRVYNRLGDAYFLSNDYKNATRFYQSSLLLQDTIIKRDMQVKTQEIFEKYNSAEKEKEILKQRAELAEQDLTIQKRNYQLFGVFGFALVLGLMGYLFYNQQKLKNQQLIKENELKDALLKIETQNRLQEQRLRISRDLHDNIGSQLTFIISSLDNLQYGYKIEDNSLKNRLESISKFTASTITDLRDTIWAMNKDEITFDDLKARIANYIEKAQNATDNMEFKLVFPENTKHLRSFSSVEGINIYRIIQEAINNSLKHAEAKTIEVTFKEVENVIELVVSDDGKGFDSNISHSGNGLNNIKSRVVDLKGIFNMDSRETGTKLIVKFPL